MKTWTKITLLALFVGLLGAGYIAFRSKEVTLRPKEPALAEPVYNGTKLTAWLSNYSTPNRAPADQALRQIGSDALPTLLRMLRDNGPSEKSLHLQAAWGIRALGSNAQSAVPELIRIADQGVSTDSRAWTIEALGFIGEPARETLPQFLKWATNAEDRVRAEAVWALGWAFGKKGFECERVLPVLTGALHDTNTLVRVRALGSLQSYGPAAKSVVPSLIELLNSDSRAMSRQTVIDTVKAIDPEAAANINP